MRVKDLICVLGVGFDVAIYCDSQNNNYDELYRGSVADIPDSLFEREVVLIDIAFSCLLDIKVSAIANLLHV